MTTGRLLARRANGLVSSFRAAATAAAAAGGRQPWVDCQGPQRQRRLSSRYFSSISATPDEGLVFTGEAPSDYDGSAVVYPNVISAEDEATILQDLQAIFGRYVQDFASTRWSLATQGSPSLFVSTYTHAFPPSYCCV
jgi:hypothetical protein